MDSITKPDRVGLRIMISSSCDFTDAMSKLRKTASEKYRTYHKEDRQVIEFPVYSEIEYGEEKMRELYSYILIVAMNTKRLA